MEIGDRVEAIYIFGSRPPVNVGDRGTVLAIRVASGQRHTTGFEVKFDHLRESLVIPGLWLKPVSVIDEIAKLAE